MSVEKAALITAGGSGLGAAAARRLAADGFRVGILSSSGKGEALGKELGGFRASPAPTLSPMISPRWSTAQNPAGVALMCWSTSAGHGPKGAVLDISDDDWHSGMDYYLMNVHPPGHVWSPH